MAPLFRFRILVGVQTAVTTPKCSERSSDFWGLMLANFSIFLRARITTGIIRKMFLPGATRYLDRWRSQVPHAFGMSTIGSFFQLVHELSTRILYSRKKWTTFKAPPSRTCSFHLVLPVS